MSKDTTKETVRRESAASSPEMTGGIDPVLGEGNVSDVSDEDIKKKNKCKGWLSLFQQLKKFGNLTAESRQHVSKLEQTLLVPAEKFISELDAREEKARARSEVDALKVKYQDACTAYKGASEKLQNCETEFSKVWESYWAKYGNSEQEVYSHLDQVFGHLQNALESLNWYKEQWLEINKQHPLSPVHRDRLGQTCFPSTVWEVPIKDDITETIALEPRPSSTKAQLAIEEVSPCKWKIEHKKIKEAIILIRRVDDLLQIEWIDQVEWIDKIKKDPDTSGEINTKWEFDLIITHIINKECNIFCGLRYPLFANSLRTIHIEK